MKKKCNHTSPNLIFTQFWRNLTFSMKKKCKQTYPNLIFPQIQEEMKRVQAAEREKRAAAAERRMAAAAAVQAPVSTATAPSNSRPGTVTTDVNCSCCQTSLAGIVPFHRYNYKYCSTTCMHVHREMLEDE